MACPAIAEPTNSSDTFPVDGYILEDYIYTDAAFADNMDGTYEGEVDADAIYTNNEYNVVAGTYLPADSEELVTCEAGSFCPGIQNTVYYDENNAQGITECPAGYPNSISGATSDTQCYTSCATTGLAHALTVTGNDYYGTGEDTCEITACERGWHVRAAIPDLATVIGLTGSGTASAYIKHDGTGSSNASSYGLTSNDKDVFIVDYGTKGKIRGMGRCSTVSGTNNNSTWSNPSTQNTLADETGTGKQCWCRLDGYGSSGEAIQSFSAPWVFDYTATSATDCTQYCVDYCSGSLRNSFSSALAFRAGMFNSVQASPAMCAANVITINWDAASTEDININNAGTVEYGGSIRTPRAAESRKGKTFRGWVLRKHTQ